MPSVMRWTFAGCGRWRRYAWSRLQPELAKLVMTETDHVMMVGQARTSFARTWVQTGRTADGRIAPAWLVWKKSVRDKKGHTQLPSSEVETGNADGGAQGNVPERRSKNAGMGGEMAIHRSRGTINALALNSKGRCRAFTTTERPWRGKSPGAIGRFADHRTRDCTWIRMSAGAGSTGRGEENIRMRGRAQPIVENMRHGMTAARGVLDSVEADLAQFQGRTKRGWRSFDIQLLRVAQGWPVTPETTACGPTSSPRRSTILFSRVN